MNLKKYDLVFFEVLSGVRDYLNSLVLVGGWLPYIYTKFLWKNSVDLPVTTFDIDFGINGRNIKYEKTIFEKLSSLGFSEKHLKIGKSFPVVFTKDSMPIEFITSLSIKPSLIKNVLGDKVFLNRLEHFDFLLNNVISLDVFNVKEKYKLLCPSPAAFIFHKSAILNNRDYESKSKDLYYIYFVLRYASDLDCVFDEIERYQNKKYFNDINIKDNLKILFENLSSEGCVMVEKENGPDYYIEDLRKDIFNRFNDFIKILK
jgi:hypothetical protein